MNSGTEVSATAHHVELFIDGVWCPAASGATLDVIDPATEEQIGKVAWAGIEDLDRALGAAKRGFRIWKETSPLKRAEVLKEAARLLRERADSIALILTREQGKPLAEALIEIDSSAEMLEWCGEEARRSYGRIIPARLPSVNQLVTREPVGPVAAFTPWNFPVSQSARKLGAALAAGCSIIIKPAEETPGAPAELVRVLADAGLPHGAINLVYGVPAEISSYLVAHPIVRKISFTGSTAVGKQLASLAGVHMKLATMELGGHAPAIVFDDADIDKAARILAASKFRNAGQVCIAPTRFLVQEKVLEAFNERFVGHVSNIRVGSGMAEGTTMGPLANDRRLNAVETLIDEAVSQGAERIAGGKRASNKGYFFEPTVLANVPVTARAMNEEPFGPVALISSFQSYEEAVMEANRLNYGLAAYAYTRSSDRAARISRDIESGMLSINHHGLGLAEVPFGGIKDSGHGSEGGLEAVEAYMVDKFVSHAVS